MVEINLMRRQFLLAGSALVVLPRMVFARDVKWAKPLKLDGMPNLNLVAPNLYRSAQPTAEGFKAARDCALKFAVNTPERTEKGSPD